MARTNPPLLHLLGMVVLESGEVRGVREGAAGRHEARRGLLAGFAVEERLDPQSHSTDTDASEPETLLGDIRFDVSVVGWADRPLDELHETERPVVGNMVPHLRNAHSQEPPEGRPVVRLREREEFFVGEVVEQSAEGSCSCSCHGHASFRSLKSSTPSHSGQKEAGYSGLLSICHCGGIASLRSQ